MNKQIAKIVCTVFLAACMAFQVQGQVKSEYVQIISKFEQWKVTQYKRGTFETEKRCNMDTVSGKNYNGPGIGIPKDIDISYTDINNDGKLDAIVMFHPDQCDGGNALMNAQISVWILSSGASYVTDDTFINIIENRLKKGWLNIESAINGTFFGTYYEYKDSDGRCCPSIRRPIQIDHKTKKTTFSDNQ